MTSYKYEGFTFFSDTINFKIKNHCLSRKINNDQWLDFFSAYDLGWQFYGFEADGYSFVSHLKIDNQTVLSEPDSIESFLSNYRDLPDSLIVLDWLSLDNNQFVCLNLKKYSESNYRSFFPYLKADNKLLARPFTLSNVEHDFGIDTDSLVFYIVDPINNDCNANNEKQTLKFEKLNFITNQNFNMVKY